MHAFNRGLLALALCTLFAAPSLAGDKDPPTKATTPASSTATKSTDAVSARATLREAGKMKDTPLGSAAKANPGTGNWWAEADIDGDGQLSAAEAKVQAGLHARFADVDGDADGFVSDDEYRKFFNSEASRGEPQPAKATQKK